MQETFLEKAGLGLTTMAIGIFVVFLGLIILIGMIIHWLPTNWKRRYRLWFTAMPLWLMTIVVCVALVVIYQFVSAEMQPFIYFQF